MKKILYCVLAVCLALVSCSKYEADFMQGSVPKNPQLPTEPEVPEVSIGALPQLSVKGRFLVDAAGKTVNLHGFTDTYSPYFDEYMWDNYDVNACLNYKQDIFEGILNAGWKLNFVRLHMDPYWSNIPGQQNKGEADISAFSMERFKKYFDEVFLAMAKYYISKGCYVVMRPPGVCPERIDLNDSYHQYLKQVWGYVSNHEFVKNNSDIMFELANEPVNVCGDHWQPAANKANATKFFQEVIDVIRNNGAKANVIWVPGQCWQQNYQGYVAHPIKDNNFGFAVHCYPGWYGSDSEGDTGEGGGVATKGYGEFKAGWDDLVGCVAKTNPIMVTEIDWAPAHYKHTWGKGITGTAGGMGFGANFKKIADESGNVSWLYFTTTSEDLANFKDEPGTEGSYTFLNDPEACPWQMYHWFKEYAEQK